MAIKRRVKAVSFDPELLSAVEAAAMSEGHGFSEWVRGACVVKLGGPWTHELRSPDPHSEIAEQKSAKVANTSKRATARYRPKPFKGPFPK